MFNKERQSQTFKFKKSVVDRLEKALEFLNGKGHELSKTSLLEQAIEDLPVSDDQLESRNNKDKPTVPPLNKIYSALQEGRPMSRMDLEFIAEEARAALKVRHGELTYQPLLVAMHDAFTTVWHHGGVKMAPQREGLDSYYKGNLVRQLGTLEESIKASREIFQDPAFRGSPEFPARNLGVAARKEPFVELDRINTELHPTLKTVMQGAIRNHYVKSQNTFQPVPTEEPDSAEYFEKHSKTESLVSGIFRLDVLWDHSTAGGELTLNTGAHTPIIRCGNFVVLMDLLILLDNISRGGPGGTRGPFTLEVMSQWSTSNGAAFQFRTQGAHLRFMLSDSDLEALADISKRFWNPPGVFQKMEHLTWLYGMG